MQNYILFIDTETTGLPTNWSAPHSASDKWPAAVQVAWMIYDAGGQIIKRENYYINNNDIPISKQAELVHHLDIKFLTQYGRSRAFVMELLAKDLMMYEPLVVGHFVELDFHVIGADFHRCNIVNPMRHMPLFCTMLISAKYARKPWVKYLKLNELYHEVLSKDLIDSHNAAADVEATALCFFALQRRGDITEEVIKDQQKKINERGTKVMHKKNNIGILLIGMLLMLFLLFVIYLKFNNII
ncbi:3'-5' exonuclease [Olivibacter sp. SDN3]|uniref:3'-5' exonuclease n=1 Tax=Olivibacter sp. SDN3 TaxID=2764720 RepID=UPI00165123D6|nr:3'-5' exonuclease [Olivibacter sp. SDN3]QNL49926.1 3'-5' exonuclease [Olivibacter sp. SDN3]